MSGKLRGKDVRKKAINKIIFGTLEHFKVAPHKSEFRKQTSRNSGSQKYEIVFLDSELGRIVKSATNSPVNKDDRCRRRDNLRVPQQRHPLNIARTSPSSSIFLLDSNNALASPHPEAEWIRSTVVTSLRRRYRSLNRVLQQKAPKSSSTRSAVVFVPKFAKSSSALQRTRQWLLSARKRAYVSRHKNRFGRSSSVCRLPRYFSAVIELLPDLTRDEFPCRKMLKEVLKSNKRFAINR
ncbi:hypothetical protein TcasGA2_TC003482 [Tribolium castaneum]|uniref:Uncharacterized protein n=1 Tax=Tribolium castaneum TaxID=7070 RepID=D6WGZ5_TRICA|nr:hypothetical protein TcasGA2_TC003482 [Tribolium castaneum]